jgi:hypothetical protein
MTAPLKKTLSPQEIANLSSPYLSGGIRQDVWDIVDISVEDKLMVAHVRMRSLYTSPTDKGGFHLTILSTLEFLSQLMMIFVHVWAGYSEKTKEGWMLESSISCKRAIRDSQNIEVRMRLASIRKVKGSILITTKSEVSDKDGLFEATLKGLLS